MLLGARKIKASQEQARLTLAGSDKDNCAARRNAAALDENLGLKLVT